jgi:hypothetical protein
MANKRKDITGNRYGLLTAVKPTTKSDKGLWNWLFQCDCGNKVERSVTFVSKIKTGVISSCGCNHHLKKHGMSHKNKNLYWVWVSMRQRCSNEKCKDYRNYGGRGIKICGDWDDYSNFHEWALSSGYYKGLTIERVDVNGDYSPSNCTWVANEKQALNTRKINKVEYKGKTMTLREVSEATGVNLNTLKNRMNKGLTLEESLNASKVSK